MSAYVALLSLLTIATLVFSSSAYPTLASLTYHDLEIAIEEMKRANYFTFVMLINIAFPNIIKTNITFLMPNDHTLATTIFPNNNISDFLLRHSIPSPLLFDHLLHIPTGSMIPTSKPNVKFKISNNGRRSFYLNNARLISPNLCTAGYTNIRCHGIDGVIKPTVFKRNDSPLSSPTCSSNSSSPTKTPPPTSGSIWPSPIAGPPVSGPGLAYPLQPLQPSQQDDPKRPESSHAPGERKIWAVFVGLLLGSSVLLLYVIFR